MRALADGLRRTLTASWLVALSLVFVGYGLMGSLRGWALGADSSVYQAAAARALTVFELPFWPARFRSRSASSATGPLARSGFLAQQSLRAYRDRERADSRRAGVLQAKREKF